MIKDEEEKVMQWASFTDKDNSLVGETFDLLEFKYSMPDPEPDDAEYKERNNKLLHLTAKKENHQPVSPNQRSSDYVNCLYYNKNQVTTDSCKILPACRIS